MPTNHLEFKSGWDDSAFYRGLRQMASEVKKETDKIEFNFKVLGDRLKTIGTAGVAGFAFAVKGAVEFGSAIRDSADALDLSTDAFQGYVGVLEQSGVSQEKFESGMVRLKKAIEDAKSGNIELVKTFEDMGVSWDVLSSGSLEDVLQAIATGLSSAADAGKAFNAATDVFGKGSQKFVAALRENGSEFDANTKLVSKLADDQIAKLDALGDAWTGLSWKVKVSGSDFFSRLNDWIDMLQGNDPESFSQSARVYTPNPFGTKAAEGPAPDPFAGLQSLTGPKDPRTVKAEKDLDEALEKANRDSEKWHEERDKATKAELDAQEKTAEGWRKLADALDELAREKKKQLLSDKLRQVEGLQADRANEVEKEIDFNLSTPDQRRSAFRQSLANRRAESRANRKFAAENEPWRRYRGARAFEGELGGNANKVALDDASIKKLTTEINKLIVAP